MRRSIGILLGLFVRLWVWTFRVKVCSSIELESSPPAVFAFWHGRQMALFGAPRGSASVAMVSRSRDGELQSGILRALGVRTVRGSSSRGGASALGAIVRRLSRGGEHALFAVDGPRGPAFVAKRGAAKAALLAQAPLFPVASRAAWAVSLSRVWDDFLIVLPFSRVVVVVGAPLDAGAAASDPRLLDAGIHAAAARAKQELALWGARSATEPRCAA
jgi:hypothetical protein